MITSIDASRRTPPCPQEQQRPAEAPALVRVLIIGRRRRALCTCGWVGRCRLLHCRSVLDALMHAAHFGCQPAVPLVDVDIGRRP
ncbi:hypothetical protein [Mycobacterium gallinarum]|uniref:hypothetical protein n=1 Tax=Mycobacterium gallinarum TaxID=39689 RepID=UPI0013D31D69|nr:hypothetical protein [Mycobacterium gallinarum]